LIDGLRKLVARLLLIDDDPALVPKQLRRAFPEPSNTINVSRTGKAGIDLVRSQPPDVILLDLRLPDMSGLEVYQQIRQIDARIPVIFITADKTADAAIAAMQDGAYDYLFKPLDLYQLQRVAGAAIEVSRRMRERPVVAENPPDPDVEGAIIGSCPAMRDVYKAIGRVAGQNVPVLITGESGTGKDLVALALYHHSARSRAPFLALNCAAIPEHLLESELFGHEKGSFTGADRRRIGKFEQCNGGTLFLDEIGDMPLALQAKMLRLLQDQTFERVGGNETVRTDVRLIAATNRDLRASSQESKFRPDLYFRLSVFTIHLPPLCERGDDLLTLIKLYMHRYNRELQRQVTEIAPEALNRLRNYSWPGNIRELQSVLKQALLQANDAVLLAEFLPAELAGGGAPGTTTAQGPHFRAGRTLAEMERDAIVQCLSQNTGNRQQTAKALGISTRTLLRKIQEYGLKNSEAGKRSPT
jgi:two-component system response regulator AtoC